VSAAEPESECPATARRGIRISDFRYLIQDRAAWLCNKRGLIFAEIESVKPIEAAEAEAESRLHITTLQEHHFGRFDAVRLQKGEWHKPMEALVRSVLGPKELIVGLAAGEDSLSALQASVVDCAMNMYHLCSEVVIPSTTLQECVIELKSEEDVQLLRDSLDDGVNLSIKQPVNIGGREVQVGLTVHGRLGSDGTVRRRYWSMQTGRKSMWATKAALEAHLVDMEMPMDAVPKGYAEVEQRIRSADLLKAGDWVVLRRGVSYAELCGKNVVNAFLSHWWGEPSYELLSTLQHFAADRGSENEVVLWICTMANNQHCVELGASWRESPFNMALEYLAARQLRGEPVSVLMALDKNARTWTRIWCAFEAYRCRHLELAMELYHIDGRLQRGDRRPLAKQMIETVRGMDLQNATASEPSDKNMILEAIHSTVGMVAVHAMLKLNIMDLSTFVGTLATSIDVLTGKELEEVPVTIVRKRSAARFGADDAFREILSRPEVRWVITGAAGAGKSVLAKRLVRLAQQHSDKEELLPVRVPLSELSEFWKEYRRKHGQEVAGSVIFDAWARHQFGKDADSFLGQKPAQVASQGLGQVVPSASPAPVEGWAWPKHEPKLLILLDGFDEAGETRTQILYWLERWLKERRDVIAVLLTRPSGLEGRIPESKGRDFTDWLESMGFAVHEILRMTKDDAKQMLLDQPHMPDTALAKSMIEEAISTASAQLLSTPMMVSFISHYIATHAHEDPGSAEATTKVRKRSVNVSSARVLKFALGILIEQAAVELRMSKGSVLKAVRSAAYKRHRKDGGRIMREELFPGKARAIYDAAKTKRLRLLEPAGEGVQIFHLKAQEYLCAEAILRKDETIQSFMKDGRHWDGRPMADNTSILHYWTETLRIALDIKMDAFSPYDFVVRLEKESSTQSWGLEFQKVKRRRRKAKRHGGAFWNQVSLQPDCQSSAALDWNRHCPEEFHIRTLDTLVAVNDINVTGHSIEEIWAEINASGDVATLRLLRDVQGLAPPHLAYLAAEVRHKRALRSACKHGRIGSRWCGFMRSTVKWMPTGCRVAVEEWTPGNMFIFLWIGIIASSVMPIMGIFMTLQTIVLWGRYACRRYLLRVHARRPLEGLPINSFVLVFAPVINLITLFYWTGYQVYRLGKKEAPPAQWEIERGEADVPSKPWAYAEELSDDIGTDGLSDGD